MLRHIGIHIHDKNEINGFYREILGFQELNRFDLNDKTAQNVFGTSQLIEVVRMKQFELIIELMVCPEEKAGGMGCSCSRVLSLGAKKKKIPLIYRFDGWELKCDRNFKS